MFVKLDGQLVINAECDRAQDWHSGIDYDTVKVTKVWHFADKGIEVGEDKSQKELFYVMVEDLKTKHSYLMSKGPSDDGRLGQGRGRDHEEGMKKFAPL